MSEYGFCQLFSEYDITTKQLNKISLRSSNIDQIGAEAVEGDDAADDNPIPEMLTKDSIVALAADKKSRATFYLLKITQEEQPATSDDTDVWGTCIKKGQLHLRGQLFETITGSDRKFKLLYTRMSTWRKENDVSN